MKDKYKYPFYYNSCDYDGYDNDEKVAIYYFKILTDDFFWIPNDLKKRISFLFLSKPAKENNEQHKKYKDHYYSNENKEFKNLVKECLIDFFKGIDVSWVSNYNQKNYGYGRYGSLGLLNFLFLRIEQVLRIELTLNPFLLDKESFLYTHNTIGYHTYWDGGTDKTYYNYDSPKEYNEYLLKKHYTKIKTSVSYPSNYLDDLYYEQEEEKLFFKRPDMLVKTANNAINVPYLGKDINGRLIVNITYQNINWLSPATYIYLFGNMFKALEVVPCTITTTANEKLERLKIRTKFIKSTKNRINLTKNKVRV